jgi:hypothetical protein
MNLLNKVCISGAEIAQPSGRQRISFLLIICMILLFASCKKKDQVTGVVDLAVIHASPNAGRLDLAQNMTSFGSFVYLTGIEVSPPGYVRLDSGFNNYMIRQGGTEYSRFLLNNTSTKGSLWLYDTLSTLKYLLLPDQLDTPGRALAKVRFLFLSPDMDTINLIRNNADTIYRNAVYFKSQQQVIAGNLANFRTIDTGRVQLRLMPNHSTVAIRNWSFHFQSNVVYSFVVKGYRNRAGADSLSITTIRHN